MREYVFSGQLNRRVGFYENTVSKNDSGESVETEQLLKERFVKRVDAIGSEDEDGRLLALAVCRFQMRFDKDIAAKASQLFIRDFDGDWQVVGPFSLLDGRRRYMELKCRKRGED